MSQYCVPQSNTTHTETPQSYTQQQVSYVQQQTTVPHSKILQTYTPQSFMPQQSYVPQHNTSIYMPQQVQSFPRECAPSSTVSCFHPSFFWVGRTSPPPLSSHAPSRAPSVSLCLAMHRAPPPPPRFLRIFSPPWKGKDACRGGERFAFDDQAAGTY